MGYFLCTLVHGSAWDDGRGIREQEGWDHHAAFMDQLVEDGFIIIGGPVGPGETTAHLIDGNDEAHVRGRLSDDPWAQDDHLTLGSIQPWALWLDGRPTSQRRPG